MGPGKADARRRVAWNSRRKFDRIVARGVMAVAPFAAARESCECA